MKERSRESYQIRLARKLLESRGYRVSKIDESNSLNIDIKKVGDILEKYHIVMEALK